MKRTRKIAAALLLIGLSFGMGGCMKEDIDEIREELQKQDERLAALEQWQKSVNTDILSLQDLIEALESKNFITSVTPVMDGTEEVGYTIAFQTGNPITIKHGKDGQNGDPGATPQIGVAKDDTNPTDENYYWTVKIGDGEPAFILDGNNKIPVTGGPGAAGHTPVLSVADNNGVLCWQVDGNWLLDASQQPVPATGEQGDAIFQKDGIDYTSDPSCVTFTLANGQTITVPLASTLLNIVADADAANTFTVTSSLFGVVDNVVSIRVESENADGTTILTRAAVDTRWTVNSEINGDVLTITAKPAKTVKPNETALLKVSVNDQSGRILANGQIVFTNMMSAAVATKEDLKTAFESEAITCIQLQEDLKLDQTLAISSDKEIDLNGQTLSGPKGGKTILNVNEGTVTFSNGKLDIANPGMIGGVLTSADISVGVDKSKTEDGKTDEVVSTATVIFDNVELNASVIVNYGSTVKINESVITNELYCVCTNANAAQASTSPVTIEITNTKLASETPVMINIPAKLTMDNCTVTGGWQGIMMRGGTATISNSTISLDRSLATPVEGDQWQANRHVGSVWGAGNEIAVAGITMGNNTATAYQYPTSVTLKNTQVSGYENNWAVFADATQVCTVDFKYDDQCTFSPTLDSSKSFQQGVGKNSSWITVTDGTGTTTKY